MDLESRPIRVAVVGMDRRMRNALCLFFQGPCKNQCVLVEEESAEAGIIDLDAYRGREVCDEYRKRHPDQPIILLSLHETKVKNGVFLRKPLKASDLISALGETKRSLLPRSKQPVQPIETQPATKTPEQRLSPPPKSTSVNLEHKRANFITRSTHHAAMHLEGQDAKVLIGTAPDIDPEDPQQVANAQYDPTDFLQSHLSRACSTVIDKNRCVQMETPRGAIYLLPDCNSASVKFSDSQLRTLSMVPIVENSILVSVLESSYTIEQIDTSSTVDRDALLWKTTLWASRGRVPLGTCLNTPVFLRQWPNMTRLLLFPHALRIAALWTNQPHSLLATANTLAIPQRHVFGFYSAAHALGLASTSRRTVDTLIEPTPLPKTHRDSLLSRILKRLRKY